MVKNQWRPQQSMFAAMTRRGRRRSWKSLIRAGFRHVRDWHARHRVRLGFSRHSILAGTVSQSPPDKRCCWRTTPVQERIGHRQELPAGDLHGAPYRPRTTDLFAGRHAGATQDIEQFFFRGFVGYRFAFASRGIGRGASVPGRRRRMIVGGRGARPGRR